VLMGRQTNQDGNFQEVLAAADVLSMNQKAELVKKLLSSPGLVFGDSPSRGLVREIKSASWETLAEVMEAIAARLARGEAK
jgi:ABC-type phosphonate transport system ATPase subunit